MLEGPALGRALGSCWVILPQALFVLGGGTMLRLFLK